MPAPHGARYASSMQPAQAHAPYIDTSRRRAVVAGTDIKVSQIAAEIEHHKMTPDEIVEAHPHLTLAQVHAALAYYYDHQDEIRADWREARDTIAGLRSEFPSRLRKSSR